MSDLTESSAARSLVTGEVRNRESLRDGLSHFYGVEPYHGLGKRLNAQPRKGFGAGRPTFNMQLAGYRLRLPGRAVFFWTSYSDSGMMGEMHDRREMGDA